MMFLLQLIKDGKIQALLKSGLRIVKQHGILKEGRHSMTVTLTITGEDGKQVKTDIRVSYNQGKFAKLPQIETLDTEDWKVEE